MTVQLTRPRVIVPEASSDRFRLSRAGILNVWQYDDQEFSFADGRMLLRGANGAGKSKTLEILLPFALDGDKSRITASAKHHTSLLWLMSDGYEGQARIGYVWVEFLRTRPDGTSEAFTCGVGIRASASARTATAWHFATGRRVGHDLSLEDDGGPLSRGRLAEELGSDGQVFERSAPYKEHVGRVLFGLEPAAYDDVLRLLYWLRQPQVGEDIEPAKLTEQLSQALPQLEDAAVRSAGDTFDELVAFGEQIERRTAAADALQVLAEAYAEYARSAVAERARAVVEAVTAERRARSELTRAERHAAAVQADCESAGRELERATASAQDAAARLAELRAGEEADQQRRLSELADTAQQDARTAVSAARRRDESASLAEGAGATAARRADEAQADLFGLRDTLAGLGPRLRSDVPDCAPPALSLTEAFRLEAVDQRQPLGAALEATAQSLAQARTAVSHRRAAVGVVRSAIAAVGKAVGEQQAAEQQADRTEAAWEGARQTRLAGAAEAQAAARELLGSLAEWAGRPEAPPVELPHELTEAGVAELPDLARAAVKEPLDDLRAVQQGWATRRDGASAEIGRLTSERARVASERDPAPRPPELVRTSRPDGLALWQVVDFGDGLTDGQRAGLEAALQSAGLLDAWVRPGGMLLGAEDLDVVLVGGDGAAAGHSTLADLLRPDLPDDSDVTGDDVRRILGSIGSGEGAPDAWVGADGRWRLGPAQGRASKERAQYIGATARAQERLRRLAILDAALAEQRDLLTEALQWTDVLDLAVAAVEGWAAAVPSADPLTRAWARLGVLEAAEASSAEENRIAQEHAHAARAATGRARAHLEQSATQHRLPSEVIALDAVAERLAALDTGLAKVQDVTPLHRALAHWADALELAASARARADADAVAAAQADQRATLTRARYEELLAAVGDTVRALEQRIAALRATKAESEAAGEEAGKRQQALLVQQGRAVSEVEHAQRRTAERSADRVAALGSFAQCAVVPGLVSAAGADQEALGTLVDAAPLTGGDPLPRAVASAAERILGIADGRRSPAQLATAVWHAQNDASSGPAADNQPTVASYGDLLAVTARDDAGEAGVVALADRLRAAVDSDRRLLTDREKEQFEQHVLGELGDAIRRCRRDATELVDAMNELLGRVTTSQGIRVRLAWDLRDDVPAAARTAVKLLAQPVGALLPEERTTLRDVLHELIEASRMEHPELSYREHLAAALDYRIWSAFAIRYNRPEKAGVWERLHRRSELSQGEQKVLCYLPLFAAAAAHFTSLAGAAPHAPRLVLLDDAFPKIDVRTHPLLFGLLVQLDLDFVITSERLWGDHETVPSLAIYETLRDPSQRGIAQYEYRWDGRALHAIG